MPKDERLFVWEYTPEELEEIEREALSAMFRDVEAKWESGEYIKGKKVTKETFAKFIEDATKALAFAIFSNWEGYEEEYEIPDEAEGKGGRYILSLVIKNHRFRAALVNASVFGPNGGTMNITPHCMLGGVTPINEH